MRKAIREIAAGGAAVAEEHPMLADAEALVHLKEAFDLWSEPTTESALSEKEGKNRGCC